MYFRAKFRYSYRITISAKITFHIKQGVTSIQIIMRYKFVATRCHILRLKCTKFNFGWGSAPSDPAGGAYSAPPDPLAEFKGPTSKGREGRGGTPWFLLTPPDVKS